MTTRFEPPTDLFGVPLVLDGASAAALSVALRRAWVNSFGDEPGDLVRDLRTMAKFYDPLLSGQKLRAALDAVSGTCAGRPLFSDRLLLHVGEDRCIPTPEGRVVLEVLRGRTESVKSSDTLVVGPGQAAAAEHAVVDLYREWTTRKIRKVVSLQSGRSSPLLLTSIGVGLWLLVNRNVGPSRSVHRPADPQSRRHLDQAVAEPVLAFANNLGPGKRQPEQISLYSGYALTELRRRLSSGLSPTIKDLYVKEGAEEFVVAFIAGDLARRKQINETQLALAFDALLRSYRAVLPRLASLGLSHERPSATLELRDQLLAQFRRARSNE